MLWSSTALPPDGDWGNTDPSRLRCSGLAPIIGRASTATMPHGLEAVRLHAMVTVPPFPGVEDPPPWVLVSVPLVPAPAFQRSVCEAVSVADKEVFTATTERTKPSVSVPVTPAEGALLVVAAVCTVPNRFFASTPPMLMAPPTP